MKNGMCECISKHDLQHSKDKGLTGPQCSSTSSHTHSAHCLSAHGRSLLWKSTLAIVTSTMSKHKTVSEKAISWLCTMCLDLFLCQRLTLYKYFVIINLQMPTVLMQQDHQGYSNHLKFISWKIVLLPAKPITTSSWKRGGVGGDSLQRQL